MTIEESSGADASTIDDEVRCCRRLKRWPCLTASTLCPIDLHPEPWHITS